jgi:hypothetical protein
MSEIESQLEQAAREMGVEMISQPEQMPQEESQSQESMEQAPVQVDTQPLPGEEVLEIQTEPTDQTESSLNEESTEAYVEAEEDFDVDSAVTQYLSETLGIELSSIQDLLGLIQQPQETQQAEIDERLRVIADFMAETGRNPEDWFMYQSIKPDEMSDLEAVRTQLAVQYENLSTDEIDLLLSNKYKLDENVYSEDDARISKIQLKIDADEARKKISSIRENFKAPVIQPKAEVEELQSPIDDNWVAKMVEDASTIDSITFQVGDKEFEFGLDEQQKRQIVDKNANIENFFDDYIYEDGNWDYEKLNLHRAVLDNIDNIVQSVYKQGLSDGQMNVVQKAANVDITSPKVNPQGNNNVDLVNQIVELMNPDRSLPGFRR